MHFVQRLTSLKDFALHCQGKIQFGFAGYDDDPRELFEIDEVRWYVAVLITISMSCSLRHPRRHQVRYYLAAFHVLHRRHWLGE